MVEGVSSSEIFHHVLGPGAIEGAPHAGLLIGGGDPLMADGTGVSIDVAVISPANESLRCGAGSSTASSAGSRDASSPDTLLVQDVCDQSQSEPNRGR